MPRDKGKGKAKASDERAPLLGSPSRSAQIATSESTRHHTPSRSRTITHIALLVLLSLLISLGLFIALLAASYKPSPSELSSLPRTAFAYTPPESISVLNVTEHGLLVNISLRGGIDADQALGIQIHTSEEKKALGGKGDRGGGADWWESVRRWLGHRMLRGHSQILVSAPEAIYLFPHHFTSPPLLSLIIQDQLRLPLVVDATPDKSWLKPISFTALAKPIASTGDLWEFAQHGWAEGSLRVMVGASVVQAGLEDNTWWAKWATLKKEDLILEVEMPIPQLPGLPPPGHPLDLSTLVKLRQYSFTNNDKSLTISAMATLPNFAHGLNASIPFSLPFAVGLPVCGSAVSKMAEVITDPVIISPESTVIELQMSGVVTANLSDESAGSNGTSPLSQFLQNYLHGKDSPITVRGLSNLPVFTPREALHPPTWLLSTLPSLSLPLSFPGPRPPPKIIQSVTIEHMRISESAGKMKASGTVIAQVELPHDMQDVELEVVEVRPDVLVYDGPASEDDEDEDEIPLRAFGHIHPDDFLLSTTSPSADPNFPHRLIVRAPLSDVDLDILPGRDKILSDFVSKVIFKGGAQAGVKGTASVKVELKGVHGRVRLDDLPVRGDFWVGKQR
ncbi:hypothetical protein CI109_107304 [Kwoniella shandongensis]|uniref:Uncharacterized protein n=1 Tax=Kwoniella shandongensis TaxID=1734106 RepID=A0A5M6BXE7_9TREE|nr:uncharacterized protein CI109_004768 [Kwoniella shandongensis]KAA5526991.1 hypothetical protein CI109_004768 [Kwoniella shandongensis]